MPGKTQRFGDYGERLASRFLERKGYRIITRHVTSAYGEIDIVAQDGDELVFVEVKTRRSMAFGYPEESITDSKLERLQKAMDAYMAEYPHHQDYRLDCIFISLDTGKPVITHYEGCG